MTPRVSPLRSPRPRRRRPNPFAARLLAVAILAGIVPACGSETPGDPHSGSDSGAGARLVEQRVDLMPYAREAHTAFPGRRKHMQEALVTDRFLLVETGSEIAFTGLDLAPGNKLSFELVHQRTVSARRIECPMQLVTRDAAGAERSQSQDLKRKLGPGQGGAYVEFELGGENSLRSFVLKFGVPKDGQGKPPSLLAVVRPTASRMIPAPALARKPKQIILITLDTFRADYLGCYGNEQVESPNLDSFANDNLRFESCYATANVTKPSHTSIFTSLYLKDHGVTDNYKTLGADTPSMIERLGEEGLRTAAFVGAFNFSPERSELYKRFDDYFECVARDRRAEDVNADLFPWLVEHADEDFFIWVHYFDVHAPYAAPHPHGQRMVKSSTKAIPAQTDPKYDWFHVLKQGEQVAAELYMGEIRYLDSQFGDLVKHLNNLGLYDNAHMVITADHGDTLGELGMVAKHSGLADATTRVPLMVKLPESRLSGVIGGLVSTIDIYPTLFDYLNLAPSNPLRGSSLRPLMEEGRDSPRPFVFSEHAHNFQAALRTPHELFILGLETNRFGAKYSTTPGGQELYDYTLANPLDKNLAKANSARTAELRRELEAFLADRMNLSSRSIDDDEFREAMEGLGYIEND